ncbi:MAG: Minf_1886 family protein [Phycisphaerales bacterium]|jgi:uncharacterized repeat protein (TIGR04138 family)
MSSTPAKPKVDWKKVVASAGPYPLVAFEFIREGLGYTSQRIHGHLPPAERDDDPDRRRHVNGQQLCLGLRDYAIQQYGLLAPTVLAQWHIRRTEDFGRMVYAMIECGLMSRNDEDSFEDFRAVYDFDEAFSRDALLAGIGAATSASV